MSRGGWFGRGGGVGRHGNRGGAKHGSLIGPALALPRSHYLMFNCLSLSRSTLSLVPHSRSLFLPSTSPILPPLSSSLLLTLLTPTLSKSLFYPVPLFPIALFLLTFPLSPGSSDINHPIPLPIYWHKPPTRSLVGLLARVIKWKLSQRNNQIPLLASLLPQLNNSIDLFFTDSKKINTHRQHKLHFRLEIFTFPSS